MVLLSVGLAFDILVPVLWIMVVLLGITAAHRFVKVWRQASPERPARAQPTWTTRMTHIGRRRHVRSSPDDAELTGWFTEDFTWAELATLRVVERLPAIRPASTAFDGMQPILRLSDLVRIVEDASDRAGRTLGLVVEIKHATYFESIGLPLDELFASEVAGWATPANLVVESFEQTVLGQLQGRGVLARYVFLAEAEGAPADLTARFGAAARSYAEHLTPAGLAALASEVDGVSVDKHLLLATDAAGNVTGATDLVDRAHAAGLDVFTYTLRAENSFLAKNFWRGSVPHDYGDWLAEFRMLVGTGVDGVFADQPDLVRAALAL
jgi:glycerophosphoryl diester phosphodiesterase